MLGNRRSVTISPEIKNSLNNVKTKIETNHRIWLKIILSALIPLMIGVFTVVTTLIQQRSSFQQREQDKNDNTLARQQSDRIAETLQRETILVSYLNDVSKLLMSENHSRILIHIRTKTLTTLRQLDSDRKRLLFLFLYESELIEENPIKKILQIHGADFNGIQLNGTKESECVFVYLNAYNVYLSNTTFIKCFIDRSNFTSSIMYNAKFIQSLLIRVSFITALLDNAHFSNMKISNTTFAGASLAQSNFIGTVWDKSTVDFTNANLTEAILSNEQLENSTLDNCILPNKTWGPIITRNLVINGDIKQNVSLKNSI